MVERDPPNVHGASSWTRPDMARSRAGPRAVASSSEAIHPPVQRQRRLVAKMCQTTVGWRKTPVEFLGWHQTVHSSSYAKPPAETRKVGNPSLFPGVAIQMRSLNTDPASPRHHAGRWASPVNYRQDRSVRAAACSSINADGEITGVVMELSMARTVASSLKHLAGCGNPPAGYQWT